MAACARMGGSKAQLTWLKGDHERTSFGSFMSSLCKSVERRERRALDAGILCASLWLHVATYQKDQS